MLTGTLTEKIYNFSGVLNANLKSDSHLPKKTCYLPHWKPFKNDEKCFLFHLKSSFKIFKFLSWLFGHVGKTAWLEK